MSNYETTEKPVFTVFLNEIKQYLHSYRHSLKPVIVPFSVRPYYKSSHHDTSIRHQIHKYLHTWLGHSFPLPVNTANMFSFELVDQFCNLIKNEGYSFLMYTIIAEKEFEVVKLSEPSNREIYEANQSTKRYIATSEAEVLLTNYQNLSGRWIFMYRKYPQCIACYGSPYPCFNCCVEYTHKYGEPYLHADSKYSSTTPCIEMITHFRNIATTQPAAVWIQNMTRDHRKEIPDDVGFFTIAYDQRVKNLFMRKTCLIKENLLDYYDDHNNAFKFENLYCYKKIKD